MPTSTLLRANIVVVRCPRTALALSTILLAGCAPEDEPAPEPELPVDVAYCDPVRDWQGEWSTFELEVLELLNERRAEGAVCSVDKLFDPAPPLRMNAALRCAARIHAQDMGVNDFTSNIGSDDLTYAERAQLAGYEGTPLEQNIGAAHSSPAQLVTAVMGNAALCEHVMDPRVDEVGVGFFEIEGASFPTYWAQVFGQSS